MKEHSTSRHHEKLLWIALSLTIFFIVIEIVGSLMSRSLALLSDAAHLLTDALALIISIIAIRLGRKAADKKRTFGYHRLEILAATFNASALFMVAFYIFYEAYQRFFLPNHLQTTDMLWVAIIGLCVNLIITLLLRSASQTSLNIKSAYLDAQADMLSSFAVILTALLIQLTNWEYLDSVMAIGVSLWMLPRAWALLKESLNILLEGVPEGIELADIHDDLLKLPFVTDVHDLHVWALTNGKISLTVHLVIEVTKTDHKILETAAEFLGKKYGIRHSTIQIETVRCKKAH